LLVYRLCLKNKQFKIELERKLDAQTKAKNHYKEQFTKSLQELALLKKREEANARALLKKQQAELDHLRLRYMAAEESEQIKSDEKQLNAFKNELEKYIKLLTA
jgi:centrosomal protein CEP120